MTTHTLSTRISNCTIVIVDGTLTIERKNMTFTPDETECLLELLLIWKYGLEQIALDDLED